MKNSLKLIFVALISVSLFGCKSHKEIEELSTHINCNKTIYFIWDDESNANKIDKRGSYQEGYSFTGIRLDYKKIFIESIEELSKKYKGKYIYGKNSGFPSDSVIQVSVKLEKLVWHLNFYKSKRDLQLLYSTSYKDFKFLGKSSRSGSKAMLESFEHSNLQFIMAACNN